MERAILPLETLELRPHALGPARAASVKLTKRLEATLVQGVVCVLLRLDPAASSNFMGWLFRTLGPLLPVNRVADANLRAALPELDAAARRRTVRDMWENLGRTAGEFPHLARLPRDSDAGPGWSVRNARVLTEAAARGKPAILISGHIGNWEMLPPAAAEYCVPFASIYRAASNGIVNDIILELRRRALGRDVPLFPKGARGAREALAYLRDGGNLGMLIDQKMNDGIEAKLFGLKAMTAPAVAALALRFNCPVIPGHVQRLGPARLIVIVGEPLALPDSGDRRADILQLTQAMNDCLERWIRDKPASWLWVHRRFPKDEVK